MTERADGSGRDGPLPYVVGALLCLALVAPVLGGPAAGAVGIVLAEAIVLSVGYGVLARAVDPAVRERLTGD